MAFVIYLVCCGMHGVLMSYLDISVAQWEYWISLTILIASWICGREYEARRRNNDTK